MSRHVRRLTVAGLVLALVSANGASAISDPLSNDAGSGEDAPGTLADAVRLTSAGSYDGYATEGDADWFVLDAASGVPTCVALELRTDSLSAVATLETVTGTTVRRASDPFDAASPAVLGVAAPSIDASRLLVESPSMGEGGSYEFDLAMTQASGLLGDGGGTLDAGGTRATAMDAAAGCLSGLLVAAQGDRRDVYRLDMTAGETLVLSLASTSGSTVQVLDSAGTPVDSVSSGGVIELVASATQPYYLSTTSSSPTDTQYVLGITVGPPGSDPCRPNCISL